MSARAAPAPLPESFRFFPKKNRATVRAAARKGTSKMQLRLSRFSIPEPLQPLARAVFHSYFSGRPVVIVSDELRVLHGSSLLQRGARIFTPLTLIEGVDRVRFEGSDLPELLELMWQSWLSGEEISLPMMGGG